MPKFNAQHYNAIAKEIRELWEELKPTDSEYVTTYIAGNNGTLASLILNLVKRFTEDNPNFDPMKFLKASVPEFAQQNLIERAMG